MKTKLYKKQEKLFDKLLGHNTMVEIDFNNTDHWIYDEPKKFDLQQYADERDLLIRVNILNEHAIYVHTTKSQLNFLMDRPDFEEETKQRRTK